MVAFAGHSYPAGTIAWLNAVRVRVVTVGANGNYVVSDADGVNHTAHHSALVADMTADDIRTDLADLGPAPRNPVARGHWADDVRFLTALAAAIGVDEPVKGYDTEGNLKRMVENHPSNRKES